MYGQLSRHECKQSHSEIQNSVTSQQRAIHLINFTDEVL